ncbi:MAG: hypothetical protein GX971_14255 [Firmicutes bacterium]|nr:hypothetical protein [Bacillota bacterium]
MAILAIYPYAKTLHVAVGHKTLSQTATFPLTNDYNYTISEEILPWLKTVNVSGKDLQFIVTSGQLSDQCLPSGIYLLDESLSFKGRTEGLHISSLLADLFNLSVYVIDPTSQLECNPHAFVTGTPDVLRTCSADNFVFKYLVREEARRRNLEQNDSNYIVCYLGEEQQMGALVGTQVVDSLTSADEGPFGLTQSGSLPFDSVLDLCTLTGKREQALEVLNEEGGLRGYLGLNDLQELFVLDSDHAMLIRDALTYQISKEIGALATVLQGKVQALILAGELVNSDFIVQSITERCGFVAPVSIYAGNQILPALLAGAERIIAQEPILNVS